VDDYYQLVGVDRAAPRDEIDRKIRDEMRRWQRRTANADLDRRQEAERRVKQLGEARLPLLDETKRRQYDRQLAQALPRGAPPPGRGPGPPPPGAPATSPVVAQLPHAHAELHRGSAGVRGGTGVLCPAGQPHGVGQQSAGLSGQFLAWCHAPGRPRGRRAAPRGGAAPPRRGGPPPPPAAGAGGRGGRPPAPGGAPAGGPGGRREPARDHRAAVRADTYTVLGKSYFMMGWIRMHFHMKAVIFKETN
jgi:hypothetical protein